MGVGLLAARAASAKTAHKALPGSSGPAPTCSGQGAASDRNSSEVKYLRTKSPAVPVRSWPNGSAPSRPLAQQFGERRFGFMRVEAGAEQAQQGLKVRSGGREKRVPAGALT